MAALPLSLTSLCFLLLSISYFSQACMHCCPACPKYPPRHPPKFKPPFHHPPWTPPVAPPTLPPPVVYPPPLTPPPVVQPPVVGPPKPPKHHHPPGGHVPCPPKPPTPRPPTPTPAPPAPTPTPPTPIPTPSPPTPPAAPTCPIDALKLNVCVDLLGGLIHIGISREAKARCCPLLRGIADLDAALCLCTTIRARLLNISLVLPIALELLIGCGKHPPPGFHCPPLPSVTEVNKS